MKHKVASQLCSLIWPEGMRTDAAKTGLEEQRAQVAKGASGKGSAGEQQESLWGKGAY